MTSRLSRSFFFISKTCHLFWMVKYHSHYLAKASCCSVLDHVSAVPGHMFEAAQSHNRPRMMSRINLDSGFMALSVSTSVQVRNSCCWQVTLFSTLTKHTFSRLLHACFVPQCNVLQCHLMGCVLLQCNAKSFDKM